MITLWSMESLNSSATCSKGFRGLLKFQLLCQCFLWEELREHKENDRKGLKKQKKLFRFNF